MQFAQAAGMHGDEGGGDRLGSIEVVAVGDLHRSALRLPSAGLTPEREGEGVGRWPERVLQPPPDRRPAAPAIRLERYRAGESGSSRSCSLGRRNSGRGRPAAYAPSSPRETEILRLIASSWSAEGDLGLAPSQPQDGPQLPLSDQGQGRRTHRRPSGVARHRRRPCPSRQSAAEFLMRWHRR